jgi:hypothetical protein
MPVLRIGFYQIQVNSRLDVTFEDLLTAGRTLPDDERRTLDRPDGPIRLQFARESIGGLWSCELIRIRLGEDVKKANKRGRLTPIDFDEDEGLGEETAFVYDPQLRIAAYHEHRGGVTIGNAARYFKSVSSGKVRSIDFKPVIRPAALERIANIGQVKEFIIHLAGPSHGRPLRNLGRSALSLFQTKEQFQAPKAKFHFTLGRQQGVLENVKEAVAQLWSSDEELRDEIDKLVVVGDDEDGTDREAVINLLEDRLVVSLPVELRGGRLTDASRRAAVLQAWTDEQEGLAAIYGQA